MIDLSSMLFTLYLLATLSSGANALYFATLPVFQPGQRIGALVLALVSFGTLLHSSYSGTLLLLAGGLPLLPFPAPQAATIAIQGVITLGSLAITTLVVRRLFVVQTRA